MIDFEDFSSNRFGRIATLAKRFLQHRDDLIKFFEQCVDEHSNKLGKDASFLKMSGVHAFFLVLAVSDYLLSDWMKMCCQVYLYCRRYVQCS